jgi:hypothetical protein
LTRLGQKFEPSQRESRGATAAQLQADMDSGQTGDKVTAVDYAAVPLGTPTRRAAGTPVPSNIIAGSDGSSAGTRTNVRLAREEPLPIGS